MPRKPRIYLPFDGWPAEDQARWLALGVGLRVSQVPAV
jgi:hypothetical protein